MTEDEVASLIRDNAARCGMTVQQFIQAYNNITPADMACMRALKASAAASDCGHTWDKSLHRACPVCAIAECERRQAALSHWLHGMTTMVEADSVVARMAREALATIETVLPAAASPHVLVHGDWQAVLLAVAKLSIERPGWHSWLGDIAERLGGRTLFEKFREIHS